MRQGQTDAEIVGFPPMDAERHAAFERVFYEAFPDIHHTIDEVVVAGDRITVRFTLRGTHRAPFMGEPATGRSIEVRALVLMTVLDGRVSRLDAIFDQFGLMRQLGALPF